MSDPQKRDRQSQAHEGVRSVSDLSRETNRPADSVPVSGGQFAKLPSVFGRYEVERLLGRGAMGAVYLAFDTQLGRNVALKIPKISAGSSKRLLQRLEIEAKAAAQLDHPCLCKVYDAGAIGDQCFIAMQYVEGENLKTQLDDSRKTIPEAVALIIQLAEGLSEAHELGIVHRDLKPENVMINRKGIPVIMDFGLAKFSTIGGNAAATQAGTILGSPAYMSPEQATGNLKEIDRRSDIYSLGVILFELLTGEWPFNGSAMQILGQKALLDSPSPGSIVPGLHPELSAVCHRMMAKLPVDRFQTLKDVSEALRKINLDEPTAVASEYLPQQPISQVAEDPDEWLDTLASLQARRSVKRKRKVEEATKSHPPTLRAWWGGTPSIFKLAVAGFAGFIMIALGVILFFPTRYGTLQIEIEDPNVSVRFAGHIISIDNHGQLIEVSPTEKQTLEVMLNGVVVESATQELTLRRGEKRTMTIKRVNAELIVDGRRISEINDKPVSQPIPVPVATAAQPAPVRNQAAQPIANTKTEKNWAGWQGWNGVAPQPAIAPFDPEQATKHQKEWADYLDVPVEYTNSIGMKFRLIPPGEYWMGSSQPETSANADAGAEETIDDQRLSAQPRHKVVLSQPIYLGVYEVTQFQYQQVMGANPSHFKPAMPPTEQSTVKQNSLPVEQVSWSEATAFCTKLSELERVTSVAVVQQSLSPDERNGYCLPTEAEWEFACRAGTNLPFWFGDASSDLKPHGWYEQNAESRSHPVGELKPNPFGLFDLHGNVSEWVFDKWSATYDAQLETNAAINPSGAQEETLAHVIRGGNWSTSAAASNVWTRDTSNRDERHDKIGFRVAMIVDAATPGAIAERLTARNSSQLPPGTSTTGATPSTAASQTQLAPNSPNVKTVDPKRTLRATYPMSRLRLVATRRFDKSEPFKELNAYYEDKGVLGIRSNGGVYGWNFLYMEANQLLQMKIRARGPASSTVGICFTQSGDAHGTAIWISGERKLGVTGSIFAKEDRKSLDQAYDLGEVIQPLEAWNELTCVLRAKLFSFYVNGVHVDTIDLTRRPFAPAIVSFAIQSTAPDTVVEMDEYSLFRIK